MKKKNMMKFLLIAVASIMLLALTGCEGAAGPGADVDVERSIGEGDTSFLLRVTDNEDVTTLWTVYTNEETVGDALYEVGLVDGEHTEFGLMILSVDGVVADFAANGAWWGFFVDGEMAAVGASDTVIESGVEYALVYSTD